MLFKEKSYSWKGAAFPDKVFLFFVFFPYLNHLIKSMFMNCGEMYLETTASLGKGQKKIKYSFKIHCLVENRRVQ